MKIIDRLKSNFIKEEYSISFYKNHIYILNYEDILDFSDKQIKIQFCNFTLIISGCNFKLVRKNDIELDIAGTFNKTEILNG